MTTMVTISTVTGGGEDLYGDAGDYNDHINDDDTGDYNDHIYDDNISDDNDDVHRRDCGRKREVARFLRVFVFPPSVGRALRKDDYYDDSDNEDIYIMMQCLFVCHEK